MSSVLAPAKVNLTLHILGRRSDGYHELQSLIAFAAVGDRVSVTPAASARLQVRGAFARALAREPAEDNLVWRAAAGFTAAFGGRDYAIDLEKALPVAAGIGGGSADAAAVLRLLAAQSGVAPDDPRLLELAQGLGADVPAALCNRPCLVGGFGEIVQPLHRFPSVSIVLVNPGVGVPTTTVFAGWRETKREPVDAAWRDKVGEATESGSLVQALAGTCNMLEEPACAVAPVIGSVLARLRAYDGCLLARMSGSGATCFGLFGDDRAANAAANQLIMTEPDWWVAATRLTGWPAEAD